MATRRTNPFMQQAWHRTKRLVEIRRDADDHDRRIEECRLDHEWLNPELHPNERELQDLCYFEYAYMTPYQRDEHLLREYNRVVRMMWARYHVISDEDPSDELSHDPICPVLELNVPEVRSAIRTARQHFDAMGLQYGAAMQWIIKQRIAYKGNHGIPRPHQLYSPLALICLDADDKYVRERFDAPLSGDKVDERFLATNYSGHPAQLRALDAIVETVRQGKNRPYHLGQYLQAGYISESEARARFGADLVDDAIATCGPARFAANGNGATQDPPPCMGYSYDPVAETCLRCPALVECRDFTEAVRQRQIEVTGTDNPRAKRKREATAERKRRERRRKKPEAQAARAGLLRKFRSWGLIK